VRQRIAKVEEPTLNIHLDYDYLTVGEIGNILIRLQAALRGVAGISRREQPRFVMSSVRTEKSLDLAVQLAILAIVMGAPSALYGWKRFGIDIFRLLKAAIVAVGRGEIKSQERESRESNDNDEEASESPLGFNVKEIRISILRGEKEIEKSRSSLAQMPPRTIRSIEYFLWSLEGRTFRVVIRDEESEIVIEWL
jgi:hypothetical protein